MKVIEYTESQILNILEKRFLSNPKYIIRNLYVFGWESDYLALTRSGYWYEIEVKISRSDFNADMKKVQKHNILSSKISIDGKSYSSSNNKHLFNRPNYFYYAVPEGLITKEEVPDYAGLIYIDEYKFYRIAKMAPAIHKDKIKIDLQDKFYYNWKNELSKNNKLIKSKKI
ncbi:hypothetical protein [uncultured Bacteroides sp.]|uniref:hypothetical protein n=1 Tax=uncultured Bacteroides sp. TaxID=162156 RepID=UPI002AA84EC4|nr:hypothetical protein [uncultured Bacteroides sp.]